MFCALCGADTTNGPCIAKNLRRVSLGLDAGFRGIG